MLRTAITACAALALIGCSAGATSAPTDDAFGQKVRAYLLANPEVLEEALLKLQASKTVAEQAGAKQKLAANRRALEADPRDPVIGDPKAPITVVEFFDYRCGYCKAATPGVLALVEQNKDVRVVMKELPILPDSATGEIGVSAQAARLALAAQAQGKYLAVHRALMLERSLDAAAVERIAKANGVDVARADAKATATHLADVERLAQAIGVDGTPAFIIGDTTVAGADLASIRQAVAAARQAL